MLYGSECWAVKRQHLHKLSVVEMRMLRWMNDYTRMDRIRNDNIRNKIGVAPIEDKVHEGRLRRYGHIHCRPLEAPVCAWEDILIPNTRRGRGRPKLTWVDVVRYDCQDLRLEKDLYKNRTKWKRRIHIADPK